MEKMYFPTYSQAIEKYKTKESHVKSGDTNFELNSCDLNVEDEEAFRKDQSALLLLLLLTMKKQEVHKTNLSGNIITVVRSRRTLHALADEKCLYSVSKKTWKQQRGE
jgi:hypothetical protein